jgi:hypothetical protein
VPSRATHPVRYACGFLVVIGFFMAVLGFGGRFQPSIDPLHLLGICGCLLMALGWFVGWYWGKKSED